jgi:DNA uptake protein ComE-like DNA-binding protein
MNGFPTFTVYSKLTTICLTPLTARNIAAQALHKAEEIIAVAEKKAEETTEGTAAEPMTSNLMQGAKETTQTAEKKVDPNTLMP